MVMMYKVGIKRRECWRALRSIPRWRLAMGGITLHALVLAVMSFVCIISPLEQKRLVAERFASQSLSEQIAYTERERITALRVEERRYGVSEESRPFILSELDESTRMNLLFERVSGLAQEVGISIRSFERAGHGLNSEGFVQVTIDTNFLQMNDFIVALSRVSMPLQIVEFHARLENGYVDKISFSLALSLPSLELDQDLKCAS